MTRLRTLLVTGISAAVLASPAFSQGPAGGPASGARDARQEAMRACQKLRGAERRDCLRDLREARRQGGPMLGAGPMAGDCSRAGNPQLCEQRQKVNQACAGKTGQDYMDCAASVLAPSAGG